jgi:hypothetical protein
VSLSREIEQVRAIFIDTAPIIYYIEAHPQFGPLAKEIVDAFLAKKVEAFSSVLTLTEVIAKPIESGDLELAERFVDFLKYGRNIRLVEISETKQIGREG